MEDLGGAAPRKGRGRGGSGTTADGGDGAHLKKRGSSSSDSDVVKVAPEMLTPMVRSSLTKQGYKLIGSHSGVKMCRWTKSMLRGRCGWELFGVNP